MEGILPGAEWFQRNKKRDSLRTLRIVSDHYAFAQYTLQIIYIYLLRKEYDANPNNKVRARWRNFTSLGLCNIRPKIINNYVGPQITHFARQRKEFILSQSLWIPVDTSQWIIREPRCFTSKNDQLALGALCICFAKPFFGKPHPQSTRFIVIPTLSSVPIKFTACFLQTRFLRVQP